MGSSMMGQLPLWGCRNHGSGIVRDRMMLLKEKLFRPVGAMDSCPREMLRDSRRLVVLTSSSVGIENSSGCQQYTRWRHEQPQHNCCFRHRQFSSSTRAPVIHRFSKRAEPVRNPFPDNRIDHLGNRPKEGAAARYLSSSNHNNDDAPLVTLSSITETPLDSTVMEKPYTVILMEDDALGSFYDEKDSGSRESNDSWQPFCRSKIPRDYGMSFGSVSLQLLKPSNGSTTSTDTTTTPISKALEALKASNLPTMADAILVTRGPCSSLCAQYYLESFSLKGLVMIDPILFGEESSSSNDEALRSLVSKELYPKDPDSFDRFRSQRLLVEPNSVPMMVVRTVSDDHEYFAAWRSCAQRVADRHGDLEGPYGSVPVVDLAMSSIGGDGDEEHDLTALLDHIDTWIDEDLQW